MTLYDITNGPTMQGDIELHILDSNQELVKTVELICVDDLAYDMEAREYLELEVLYVFATARNRRGILIVELLDEEA